MPSLELKAQLANREVLYAESTEIAVTVTNRGRTPAEVHEPDLGCPLVFSLLSPRDGAVLHTLSERKYWASMVPNRTEPDRVEMVSLAPGDSVTYQTDLGGLMVEPVLPGRYHLKVAYRISETTFEAPVAELTIVPPNVVAFTELAVAKNNSLITVFGQRNRDGSVALMQRVGQPSSPWLGTCFRRHTVSASASPIALAIAVDLAEDMGGSCFGWIEGEKIGAGFGWGSELAGIVPSVPVGLASPLLIEAGRRLPDGRAAFLVVGLDEHEVKLKEFTFRFAPSAARKDKSATPPPPPTPLTLEAGRTQGANPESRTVALGASRLPARILVRRTPSGDTSELQLVWAAVEEGETRIYTRYYTLDGLGGSSTPRLLYARGEPLAAMEMESLPNEGLPAAVDVLFGPAGTEDQRHMTFVRIALSADQSTSEWPFKEPTRMLNDIVEFPCQWAIASLPVAEPPVLAKLGNRLLCLWPSVASFRQEVVAQDVGTADFLHLVVLHRLDRFKNRLWATWVDPEKGVQRHPISALR